MEHQLAKTEARATAVKREHGETLRAVEAELASTSEQLGSLKAGS